MNRHGFGEYLSRRPVFEALARGVVEPGRHRFDCVNGEGRDIDIERQEPPQASVEVLYATLLPGRSRLAEVAVHAHPGSQCAVGRELCPTVKGNALPQAGGKGSQLRFNASHDARRSPAGVAPEHDEAALALHHGRQIRLAELLAEDDQVALPVAKIRSLRDA